MTAAERISLWLEQIRASGQAMRIARTVIAIAGAVALVVPALQSWDEMDLVPIVGAPLLLATLVLPDSLAGTGFLLLVGLGWLLRAPREVSWSLAITAMALVVVHLATAFAAQLPSYVRIRPAALRRWWLPTAIALLLVVIGAVAARLVQGAGVPGSLVVVAAAMALVALTIWFAAGQKLGRD
ncbi:hypothetical protein [Kribbella sp. NPDC004875]|uniref:hypothetical protein n=1 Tax=Kribbella sp. NPDC004875 TaxID=3364107 RepID=UPI00368DB9CB